MVTIARMATAPPTCLLPRRRRHPHIIFSLLVALPRVASLTHTPTVPESTPGRMPTVLPSSVGNIANGTQPPVINITGLIIASSYKNFERAAAEVHKSDVLSTVWIPAFFLNEKNYSMCGGGGNGLRHAMRNAWNLIASSGVGMAVFEEDVSYAAVGKNVSVASYIATKCLARGDKCDLAYLGEWNNFFTTHAIYVRPHAARWLLQMTETCYPWRAQIDQPMHSRCVHRPGRPPWNCIKPPAFKKPKCFGQGFFVQDPVAVPPVLHGGGSSSGAGRGNKVIARK